MKTLHAPWGDKNPSAPENFYDINEETIDHVEYEDEDQYEQEIKESIEEKEIVNIKETISNDPYAEILKEL